MEYSITIGGEGIGEEADEVWIPCCFPAAQGVCWFS